MARIRSIKPEFWTSAQVLECSTNARLLFIGLWNFCDDEGRHPWSAKQAKAEIFPADSFTDDQINEWLLELSNNGLIVGYSVGDKNYFYVTGWKHQRIDKPQPAKYPDPFQDHSGNDPRTFPPDTIGKDTIGKDTIEALRADDNVSQQTSQSVPVESPKGQPTRYSFESGIIKLNEKHFSQWQKAFSHLDLSAELIALTEWANGLGPQKWFAGVSAALAKRNREQKTKIETAKLPNPETKWRSGIEGVV